MLNGGKAVRDKDGKITEAAAFQKGEKDALPGRVQADRRWFGEFKTHCEKKCLCQETHGSSLKLRWITLEPL